MKLSVIDTGFFKLDGGAMFGVVPKTLWNKLNPADEKNLCNWAMRCLLVEDGNRLILIDTGIGNKQDDRFFSFYALSETKSLSDSITKQGYHPDEITDVILTHLHFDHCGGATKWNDAKTSIIPTFKNAVYWSHPEHWKHALQPNPREKASFLKDNLLPLQESGQLKFIDSKQFTENIEFIYSDCHTEKMVLPIIHQNNQHIVYMADLVPSSFHIPVNYVMAYDIRPLLSMEEKENFYKLALEHDYTLFFEHDPIFECGRIQLTEKGFRLQETFALGEMMF
jgi:glyoxylase-like metal-dependent hydrolase (beta-lactamase superfamily II)